MYPKPIGPPLLKNEMSLKNFLLIIVVIFLSATPKTEKTEMKQPDYTSMPDSSGIHLFLCGDVMTGRGVDQVLPYPVDPRIYEPYVKDAREYVRMAEKTNGLLDAPVSFSYIWGDALDVWKQKGPDLRIINLETSITRNEEPWPGKGIQYRMHPKNVPVLSAAEIDFCTLANNHTLDWSRGGLLETLSTLRDAGIPYGGAGEDLVEAQQAVIFKTGKGRVIMLAYGSASSGVPESWAASPRQSGVNLLPDLSKEMVKRIGEQVKAVKQPGDVVVFSVHWGSNWGYEIPPKQQRFAHQLIDMAGVDLVHGHSSHHPRGIEVYKEKLILYGAGDFITDYEWIGSKQPYRDDLAVMYFPLLDPASGNWSCYI